jgi:hypothetical protein
MQASVAAHETPVSTSEVWLTCGVPVGVHIEPFHISASVLRSEAPATAGEYPTAAQKSGFGHETDSSEPADVPEAGGIGVSVHE